MILLLLTLLGFVSPDHNRTINHSTFTFLGASLHQKDGNGHGNGGNTGGDTGQTPP
jgi:hypothetical protein